MQLSHLRSTICWYIWVCHIFFLILFQPYALSLFLPVSLSLMMGVFLFCGGCELSEFVSVSIIPSLWAPAYKSDEGPRALSHRPPVSGLSLLLYAHTATGKTVDKHTEQKDRNFSLTQRTIYEANYNWSQMLAKMWFFFCTQPAAVSKCTWAYSGKSTGV